MNMTNALEATLVFLGVVAAVRAVAFFRMRAASRTKGLVHDVTRLVALGLVLAAAPVMRPTAADVTSPPPGDAAFAAARDDAPYSATDPAGATARTFKKPRRRPGQQHRPGRTAFVIGHHWPTQLE
jgi:hypothetical protein